MFEHYTEAKKKPLPKWVPVVLIVSVAAHVIGVMALVIHGWWAIEKLPMPKGGVALAISAPPPAPPPAKKGSRKKHHKTNTKKVAKRVPKDTTQPVKLDTPIEESSDDIDSDVEGDPDGDENGVAWSTCTGPGCDPNSPLAAGPPPPPPPPKKNVEPKVVPQHAIEQRRVSGQKRIVPDDATKIQIGRSGKTRIITTVKMCLSAGGSVNRLDVIKSSGFPSYDSKIKGTMRRWKYRPFKVNGKAVPVCTAVTFIYNQKP